MKGEKRTWQDKARLGLLPARVVSAVKKAEIMRLLQENDRLKDQLHTANTKIKELRQEARDWEKAADGLARMIEEMKEKEGAGNV